MFDSTPRFQMNSMFEHTVRLVARCARTDCLHRLGLHVRRPCIYHKSAMSAGPEHRPPVPARTKGADQERGDRRDLCAQNPKSGTGLSPSTDFRRGLQPLTFMLYRMHVESWLYMQISDPRS
jgi:hypothetical protein